MSLSISELSQKSRVKVPTIRYYERVGLIPTAAREDGERRYEETEAARLSFIRHSRHLGFEMEEIRAILEMTTTGSCEEIDVMVQHLGERMTEIDILRNKLKEVCAGITAGALNEADVLQALGSLASTIETPGLPEQTQAEPGNESARSQPKRKRSRAKNRAD